MGLLSKNPGITPEEEAAMQAANNAKAGEMAAAQQDNSYMVTELHGGTGKSDELQGSSIDMKTDKKGRQYFTSNDSGDPSSVFYYNDHTGMWSSHGGSSYSIGQAHKQAPTESGGGGKPPPKKKKPPTDTMPPAWNPPPGTDPDRSGTNQSLGDQNVESMLGYEPISSDGEGGTQNLNPLADANNWLHIEDPKYMTPTYSNPMGGQQQQQSGYDVNGMGTMDYAKTGLLSPEEEALMAAGLLG